MTDPADDVAGLAKFMGMTDGELLASFFNDHTHGDWTGDNHWHDDGGAHTTGRSVDDDGS